MTSSSWTAERFTILKALWLSGASAAEISRALGGVTRNAVIGKVHRLGLAGRTAACAPRRLRSDRAAPRTPRSAAPNPPPARPASRAARRCAAAPPAPMEAVARIFDATALTRRTCRWPVGDPLIAGFGFCGASVLGSGPYCPCHHQAAYRSPPAARSRNRIYREARYGAWLKG